MVIDKPLAHKSGCTPTLSTSEPAFNRIQRFKLEHSRAFELLFALSAEPSTKEAEL